MVQTNKSAGPKAAGPCCSGLQGLLSPKLFKALSDPRRIALLIRLAEERGPCTVGQVAQGSGIDLSVVSRHLATLRDAGIIRCEKQGKEVLCRVQTKPLVTVLRNLADALEACCPESWSVELGAGVSPNRSPAGPTRPR